MKSYTISEKSIWNLLYKPIVLKIYQRLHFKFSRFLSTRPYVICARSRQHENSDRSKYIEWNSLIILIKMFHIIENDV